MKNLSREYIAEQLGLSLTSYGKIERGETDITYTRLKIAKLLDVHYSKLFDLDVKTILKDNTLF